MRQVVLVLIPCLMQTSSGAFERVVQGGKLAAMGGAVAASANDTWASFSNPGTLPTVTLSTLSLAYIPGQFGMAELARSAISFTSPTGAGVFAIGASRFGFDLYNEFTVSIGFGHRFNPLISAGLTLNYNRLSIAHYGNDWCVGLDLGVLLTISEKVQWGFAAYNINAPCIGDENEKLPEMLVTGIRFVPISGALLQVDVQKDIIYPIEICFGAEYTLFDTIAIRGGGDFGLTTFSSGLGLQVDSFTLDYAISMHPDLGSTHQLSISFSFGQ